MSASALLDTFDDAGADLAGLLDALAARGVRLEASADRRHIIVDAPRGALSPDLETTIRAHKAALLATLATPSTRREDATRGSNAQDAQEAREAREAREAARIAAWIARARHELHDYGAAHDWPRLAIASSANTHAGNVQPFKWILPGADAWGRFLNGAGRYDLKAAYLAAGLNAKTPAPAQTPAKGATRATVRTARSAGRTSTPAQTPATETETDGDEQDGARVGSVGAVLTVDDRGAYLCRGAGVITLAYSPADVATIAGLVNFAEAHDAANVWIDPQAQLRAQMEQTPAAFLADAGAVRVNANPARGISQTYTAHVSSDARPRRHTVVVTLPAPDGNNSDWPHGAKTQALALWYAGDALGWPFRGLPHYVGRRLVLKHNAARGWYERPAASYASLPEVRDAIQRHRDGAPDLAWRRHLSADETAPADAGNVEGAGLYLHGFDKASCYLSMCSSVDLPIGAPSWRAGARLEKRRGEGVPAALWHVTIDRAGSPYDGRDLPAICGEGDTWLWTPTLRVALDMGYQVTAWHGAVIWPEQHRILNTWKQRIWAAILALRDAGRYPDADARATAGALVKAVYRQTIGMFGHDRPEPAKTPARDTSSASSAASGSRDMETAGGSGDTGEDGETLARWQRPEWQYLIVAEAAARMVRHIEKCRAAGVPPLLGHTDALAVLSPLGDPAAVLGCLGLASDPETCGAFVPEYSWSLADGDIRAALASAQHQQSVRGHMLPSVRARA